MTTKNTYHIPYPIRDKKKKSLYLSYLLSQGSAIASLLLYWRWEVFSVVYSDGGAPGDVQKHLLRETAAHNLKAAMAEPIPLKVDR